VSWEVPHIWDAAAMGFPEFTADMTSFEDTVDHCDLTPLHVFTMLSKKYC
jgi:hypothetical protein